MVSHWSLNDSKSPQVSRTLLSILADLNSAVIWMVFSRVLISISSSPFTNPLVTVPSALITIGITVTFMFHSFFNSLARSRYLSLFSPTFNFIYWSANYYCYFTLLRVFRTNVSRWSFISVWVTASHLKSPWLFSVFWSISTML